MKKNYTIIIIGLIAIFVCLLSLFNVANERAKVIEYYEEIIQEECPNINHDPWTNPEFIITGGFINESSKNNS